MHFQFRESEIHKWMDKGPHDKLVLKDLWLIEGNCPLIQSITQPANFYQEFWTKARKSAFYNQCHHKLLGTLITVHDIYFVNSKRTKCILVLQEVLNFHLLQIYHF